MSGYKMTSGTRIETWPGADALANELRRLVEQAEQIETSGIVKHDLDVALTNARAYISDLTNPASGRPGPALRDIDKALSTLRQLISIAGRKQTEKEVALQPPQDDWETIELALKAYGRLALQFEYGGMGTDLDLARKAKEAFERLKHPTLPGIAEVSNAQTR